MDKRKTSQAKAVKPHAFFDEPHDVVVDPELSQGQKRQALDALEQDARQLSAASAEGMAGGEPTGLHDVLDAQNALDMPTAADAYTVVLNDLRSRLATGAKGDARGAVEKALAALMAVSRAPTPGTNSIGDPKPGSAEEVDAEIALEKLDP